MRLNDALDARPERSAWRFFPWCVALGLGVVIAVNAVMVFTALRTFPGKTGNDGFFMSNHYNLAIDQASGQAALGWVVTADADALGHPRLVLRDGGGAPLTGGRIEAVAERLVGAPMTIAVPFVERAPGQYLGQAVLNVKGQWQLLVSGTLGGRDVALTRRLVVR